MDRVVEYLLLVRREAHRRRGAGSATRGLTSTLACPAGPDEDARMGDYQATYTRSIDRPRGVLGRRRDRASLWRTPADPVLDDSQSAVLPVVPRRRAEHLRERPGPPRRGRPRRPDRAGLRQPGHRHASAPTPTPSCSTRWRPSPVRCAGLGVGQGRPGRHLPADGAGGRGGDAGLRPARRGALGRVRRVRGQRAGGPGRRRPAAGGGDRRPAASRSSRVVEYKPLLDRALELSSHQPEHVVVLQRPQAVAAMTATARPRLARADRRCRAGRVRRRWPRPTRCTSSTRPAPPRKPKGVVRDNGGHAVALAWSMANIYDVGPGDVWWTASDVGWVVGHSYIVYAPLLVGRDHGALRGQAGRHAGRRRVLAGRRPSTACRRCSPRRPRSGRSRRRTRPASCSRRTTSRALRTLFLAGERLDPDTWQWATDRLGVPGDRPLVADRDRLADRGQPARARADADQARLAHGAGAGVRRAGARPGRRRGAARAPRARSASGCRCRRARCRRCGATTTASSRRTCRRSTATT